MFKSLAFIALVAAGVVAQDPAASSSAAAPSASSNSTSTNTTNPLIPSGISSDCTTFLTSLNSDSSLTSCTSTLIGLLSSYGPGSATNHTKADVEKSLGSFCSNTTTQACPDSLIRGKLANFYTACAAELTTSPNEQVRDIYQVFYAIKPLQSAVCAKDNNGSWCATEDRGASAVNLTTRAFERRDTAAITPNLSAYQKSNLAFLFISQSLDSTKLCTPCTRNILNSYFNFEANLPYALGYGDNTGVNLLSAQTPLISTIQTTCGSSFLAGTVAAAGGLGQAMDSAAAALQTPVAALMGVLSLVAFAL